MKTNSKDPSAVSFSISLYSLLLATYPSGFRHEYGPHMAQVFRDYTLRSYRLNGLPGLLDLWIHTLLDYVKSVIEEYLQKGIHMSKQKFIRLSGWALLLGAITFLVGWLIDLRLSQPYDPRNFLSEPIDLYLEYATMVLIPGSLLFFMVGMVGLYLRYRDEINGLGNGGLIVGIFGGVLSFAGSILFATDSELSWGIFFTGFMLYFLGLAIFGIATLRDTPLPRWKALPLLTGIWFPLLVIVTNGKDWGDMVVIDFVVYALTAIGLAGMGYLLQSDSQPANPEAGMA